MAAAQEHIRGLDVPVQNVLAVDVVQPEQELHQPPHDLLFGKALASELTPSQERRQVTPLAVRHHDAQLRRCFGIGRAFSSHVSPERSVEAHDVGMARGEFQKLRLGHDSPGVIVHHGKRVAWIGLCAFITQRKELHDVALARGAVLSNADGTLRALSDDFSEV